MFCVSQSLRVYSLSRSCGHEPVSRSPCTLLKLDFLTNAMHLLYALVRKSSFSKAQGLRETGSRCSVSLNLSECLPCPGAVARCSVASAPKSSQQCPSSTSTGQCASVASVCSPSTVRPPPGPTASTTTPLRTGAGTGPAAVMGQ